VPKLPITFPSLTIATNDVPSLQRLFQDLARAIQQIVGANNNPDQGPTAQRPKVQLAIGQTFFDVSLDQPIWWDGTQWVTAAGGSNVFTTLFIGGGIGIGYELFVDTDGSLKIKAPDGSLTTLVVHS
jgi:hypothetical protein